MKKLFKSKNLLIALVVLIIISSSYILIAYPGGITGRTLKDVTTGCGGSGCHSGPSTVVSGTFTGPDSVVKGTTVQYTETITHTNSGGMGTDIAVRLGTLAPGSSSGSLHLSNGELTHNMPLSPSPVILNFNYTAPSVAGTDTLFGNVVSGFSTGWNWTPSKRILVKNAFGTGIINQTTPVFYSLSQNYPNPFNPVTRIDYQIPKNTKVTLKVFDELGNEIGVLVNGNQEAGNYTVNFDASKIASGVYFYKIDAGEFVAVKKMMLIK